MITTCNYIFSSSSFGSNTIAVTANNPQDLAAAILGYLSAVGGIGTPTMGAFDGTLASGSMDFYDQWSDHYTMTWTQDECVPTSPFLLSASDGVSIGGAILGLWAAAWCFRTVARFLFQSDEGNTHEI